MAESTATKLTPEQQAAIRYWPYTAHIGIIPADSKNKKVSVVEWPKLDLDNTDYEANLQAGLYDNGIAIRLGKCISSHERYSFALDLDGWDAVIAWFGSWERLLEAAKKTGIEWHKDQTRIHYLFLANRPLANRKINIKNSHLEIRCENQLLFTSPSIHKDGNPYAPLGTEEIAILTDSQLLQLEANIETLCQGYISDANKQEYIKWIDVNAERLGEGHQTLVVVGSSYFNRHTEGWHNLTDEQRRKKLCELNLHVPNDAFCI